MFMKHVGQSAIVCFSSILTGEWFEYNGSCYTLLTSTALSFQNLISECSALGSSCLQKLETAEELSYVQTLVNGSFGQFLAGSQLQHNRKICVEQVSAGTRFDHVDRRGAQLDRLLRPDDHRGADELSARYGQKHVPIGRQSVHVLI
ncbi:hypothetical protein Btru_074240 [Bulinus truncatus]|nr:hypothetical protein Btru_074240 [Bulinus truncatus]